VIQTKKLCFQVGSFALRDISLDINRGQYFVLLGPPGSGKSILLECLCGLKRAVSGRICIDGRDVTRREPRVRNVGYVPQDYALFPHCSVEENIAFGLRTHRNSHTQVQERVTDMVEMLGIGHLLNRKTPGLSGGERQRVALARALVLQPQVLLLDEPVSALDEATRQEVCTQLFTIQRELGLTVIHVSHNQEEAFSVADQAGILNQGRLIQTGAMDELSSQPQSEFVARFMRCENILHGTALASGSENDYTMLQCQSTQVRVPGQHQGKVTFMVRPEYIIPIRPDDRTLPGHNVVRVSVSRIRQAGQYMHVRLSGELALTAYVTRSAYMQMGLKEQDSVAVYMEPKDIYVLPD